MHYEDYPVPVLLTRQEVDRLREEGRLDDDPATLARADYRMRFAFELAKARIRAGCEDCVRAGGRCGRHV